jgi:hypothetical protein
MQPKLPNLCVQIALTMVGRHEQPLGSNAGPQIQEFFDADSYKPNSADNGYAWCASFVCRIVQLAMAKTGTPYTFKRPTTPSAFGLAEWSREQDASTNTKDFPTIKDGVKAGDIVIFTWSHCGIAITDSNSRGEFETVEGNTNAAGSREGTHVVHKKGVSERSISGVRNRIRFTV